MKKFATKTTYRSIRLLFITVLISTVSFFRLTAQPTVLRPDIKISPLIDVGPGNVRLTKDPVSGNLFFLKEDGSIYEVINQNGSFSSRKLYDTTDHGIDAVQGMAFYDKSIFLSGNIRNDNFNNIGKIVKGELQPDGTRIWSVVATSEVYGLSNTAFDHGFSGIAVSPDGKFLFVSSGSRTDHGEVQSNNDVRPGVREEPLTSAIFRIPADGKDIWLKNDSTYLASNGYLFADGTRNSFDLEFASNGELFGCENSGDRDDPEELNWIKEGKHYGFPWNMGGNNTPQQFGNYNPSLDKLLNPRYIAVRSGFFYNDPTFPLKPNVNFMDPIQNFGPDADRFRDSLTGNVIDASDLGIKISTFSPHRSPLGLVFDKDSLLSNGLKGGGFLLGWTPGSSNLRNEGPLADESEDLSHIQLQYNPTIDNYEIHTTRVVRGFNKPIDAFIDRNIIYVIEYDGTKIWKVEMPSDIICKASASVPATPANFRGIPGNKRNLLYWNQEFCAQSYTIKRSTIAGGPYTTLATGISQISYADSAVVNGTTYYYAITSVNSSGESPISNEISLTPCYCGYDLVVTDITWEPVIPVAGEPLVFTAIVQNVGNIPTPETSTLGVGFGVNGEFVACSHGPGFSLGAGETIRLTANDCGVSFIPQADQTYRVYAYVDDVNRIPGELNEGNNVFTKVVGNPPNVDLVIKDIFWQPKNPKASDSINFYVEIENVGSETKPAGTPINAFFVFNNEVFIPCTAPVIDSLEAGESIVIGGTSCQPVIPAGDGVYSIIAVADNENTVFETNESNNIYVKNITVGKGSLSQEADLILTDLSWKPQQPFSGDSVIFTATIKNIGKAPIMSGSPLVVSFGADGAFVACTDTIKVAIEPGESLDVTATGCGGAWIAGNPGVHNALAIIDEDGLVPEGSENNNFLIKNIIVGDTSDRFKGHYHILAKHSNKAMTVALPLPFDGIDVLQRSVNNCSNQIWEIKGAGDGYYKIVSKLSGKALDIYGKYDKRVNLRQMTEADVESQKWKIETVGDGYFKITNKEIMKSLEVFKGLKFDWADIVLGSFNNKDFQTWIFKPLSIEEVKVAEMNDEQLDNTIDQTANLKIYPNPAKKDVTVELNEEIEEVTILNSLGVESLKLAKINSLKASIKLNQLSAGLYFVRVKTKNAKVFHKQLIID